MQEFKRKLVTVISMKVNREEATKFNGAIYTNVNYLNYRLNIMQEINITNTINFINITLDEILRRLYNLSMSPQLQGKSFSEDREDAASKSH